MRALEIEVRSAVAVPASAPKRRRRRHPRAPRSPHTPASCRRRASRRPRLAAAATGSFTCAPGRRRDAALAGARGAGAGARADALRAGRRRRPDRVLRTPSAPTRWSVAVRPRRGYRPKRRPWPWEALAWAVTEQLIEVQPRSRDPAPHRATLGGEAGTARFTRVAGERMSRGPAPVRCATCRQPTSSPASRPPSWRPWTSRRRARSRSSSCAREVAKGRVDLAEPRRRRPPAANPRDRAVDRCRCLGLGGRGDPDSLPAGDLAYVKLVGHADRPRPPGDRRGGRGVLRAVRAVSRPRRRLRADPLGPGDGRGPAGQQRRGLNANPPSGR